MSVTPTIRDADAPDVPAIVAIERESFGDPWSEKSFRSLLGSPACRFRVAEHDGQVLGYAIAWIIGEEAELANLAVQPSGRRAGVGAALLDDLLQATDRGRGTTIYLEVRAGNHAAQALYRSRGFVAAGVRKDYYTRPSEDAMVMRREPRTGASVRPVI